MLIAPTERTDWRADVEDFHAWLSARWPDAERRPDGTGGRAFSWEWSDRRDVWIPVDRECVWIGADWPLISAIAAWFAPSHELLVLSDESYSDVIPLAGVTESMLLAMET